MIWPILIITAAALQIVRNAAQRNLSDRLGLWGAAYIRFIYGLPFGVAWLALVYFWRGPSGAPSLAFWLWVILGAATQGFATAALVYAMRGRAFAIANVLQKTEVLGAAIVGVLLINDALAPNHWLGAVLGTAGIALMAHVSIDRDALRAALSGAGAGLLFAVSSVSYRAAAHAWGGDEWLAAAATLTATLGVQTLGGAILLVAFARDALPTLLRAWRPSLVPGAAGAIASALIFTSLALGPSASAVKTVQLVDVLIGWLVSRRLGELIRPMELIGAALVVAGAVAALL